MVSQSTSKAQEIVHSITDPITTTNRPHKAVFYGFLVVSVVLFGLHVYAPYLKYFTQLTVIGQILSITNIILVIRNYHLSQFSKAHSRFYLLTIGLETVVIIGFWSIRLLMKGGIVNPNEVRTWFTEFLSVWMHGGSFLLLLFIETTGKVQLEFSLAKKFLTHVFGWCSWYILVQVGYFYYTGSHIYPFIKMMPWKNLVGFESMLLVIAIIADYFVTFMMEHRKVRRARQQKHHQKKAHQHDGECNHKHH